MLLQGLLFPSLLLIFCQVSCLTYDSSKENTPSQGSSTTDGKVTPHEVAHPNDDFIIPISPGEFTTTTTASPVQRPVSSAGTKKPAIPIIKTRPRVSVRPTHIQVFSSVPQLPDSYVLSMSVSDIRDDEEFQVTEQENGGKGKHIMEADGISLTCLFNLVKGDGFLVEGVKCDRHFELPKKCFCTSKFCRPYVSVRALLDFIRRNNATLTKQSLPGSGKVVLWSWNVTSTGMTIEAVYASSKMHPSSSDPSLDYPNDLAPVSFTVKGAGRVFLLPSGDLWLQYRVKGWSLKPESLRDMVQTAPGVFCPSNDQQKFLPSLANQFSLTMETVIENLKTIAYERHHYDSIEKLVSFTFHPHLHADGMFLLDIPGLQDLTLESYRVVHDFKTGLQYMLNEKSCNCSIQVIPLSSLDAAPTENQHVRLRHASELISINPNVFLYKGSRSVHGVFSDVWVAERGETKGRYSTVEVYFSHDNWTVEMEVFNKVRRVPVGVSTYVADTDAPTHWESIVHTYFTEYHTGHPSWDQFDVSPCFSRINRIFLVLTLEISYAELVHYNIEMAKNSIRRAIAGIAGVSPLRVTDLFLSSRPSTGETDVWFIFLEKPNLSGPVLSARPQLLMADAYKLLHDLTHKVNVSMKLDLSPTKKPFVTIKAGSLQTSTEALHPNLSLKKLRYVKAGYTAGSMAGLGFSMAILGTCVGLLVGFLLWKRSTGVPYHVTD